MSSPPPAVPNKHFQPPLTHLEQLFWPRFYLLALGLPLLPQLLQVSTLVHVVQVEIGFPLGLRHLGAKPLLQHRLLVGQPLAQVGPLEPVQILQTGKQKRISASRRTVASGFHRFGHLENAHKRHLWCENQLKEASADVSARRI